LEKEVLPQVLRIDDRLGSTPSATSGTGQPNASPADVEARLNQELANQRDWADAKRSLVFESRGDLRKELQLLRAGFAKRLDYSLYCIFDNKTLDTIVTNLPTKQNQLLKCYGMGHKRCQSYGADILRVVLQYKKRKTEETSI